MLVPDQVRVEQMEGLAKEVMQFFPRYVGGEAAVSQSGAEPVGAASVHMAVGYRRCAAVV